MKTLITSFLFICITVLAIAADTPILKADHRPDVNAQLLKVERDINEAFKARDKNTLAALCAEDCAFTDEDGKLSDKTHFLKSVEGSFTIVSYTLRDLVVHDYGDTGIVNGQWSGTIKTENEESKAAFRFTDTFVRRNACWYVVATHMTRLAGDAAEK